jgi:hypothetical protein
MSASTTLEVAIVEPGNVDESDLRCAAANVEERGVVFVVLTYDTGADHRVAPGQRLDRRAQASLGQGSTTADDLVDAAGPVRHAVEPFHVPFRRIECPQYGFAGEDRVVGWCDRLRAANQGRGRHFRKSTTEHFRHIHPLSAPNRVGVLVLSDVRAGRMSFSSMAT